MPPAFALSQDQTLRFISAPMPMPKDIAVEASTNRPELYGPSRCTMASPSLTGTAFKAYCNASKRHAIARPQSQTNEIQVLLETQTAGPAAQSAPRLRTRPEGAANVSLPSLCNCQRSERNRPQPRTIRAYRLTCSDVRQSGRRTENLAQLHPQGNRQNHPSGAAGAACRLPDPEGQAAISARGHLGRARP